MRDNASSPESGPVSADEINEALEFAFAHETPDRGQPLWKAIKRVFSNGLDFSEGSPFPKIFDTVRRLSQEHEAKKRARWRHWSRSYGCGSTGARSCGSRRGARPVQIEEM